MELKEVELVGLADLDRSAAQAMAERFDLPADRIVFESLKEAVEATGADCVFDATIPAAHAKVTLEALRLGCHVVGEKPMSDNLADARRMVAAAQETGLSYAVMQNRRFSSPIRAVKKALGGGKLGAVEELNCDFYLGPHFGGFRDEMDYPLLVDMAIHTFDQARFIADADPKTVYCHSFNPARSWYAGDASAQCIFEMEDAAGRPLIFNYRGSWCAQGLATSWQADWRAVCHKGSLRWDGESSIQAQRANLRKKPARFRELEPIDVPIEEASASGHRGMIEQTVRRIQKGRTPETVCTDNIKSLAMVFAAVESAKKNRKVEVKW